MSKIDLRAAMMSAFLMFFFLSSQNAVAQMTQVHGTSVIHENLEISGAFARATLPSAPVAGAYFTINNLSETPDNLLSVKSQAAGMVQLHNMSIVDDVMEMYEMANGIPLPSGESVILEPGGLHVMLMQLRNRLIEGNEIMMTLTFEHAGDFEIRVPVVSMRHKNVNHGAMQMDTNAETGETMHNQVDIGSAGHDDHSSMDKHQTMDGHDHDQYSQ